jgi:hypothetical protein
MVKTMQDKLEKAYVLQLTYNEIHLILNSLDEFLENNPHLREIKSVTSIQNKLLPLHLKHTQEVRDNLG